MTGSADPILIYNGNYTSTVWWEFQDPSNYTTTNLDLSSQEAKLARQNASWEQTTESDFDYGTFNNTIATSDGKVTLSNLTKNAIDNGNFTTSDSWIFGSSPTGEITSEWDGVDQNARYSHFSAANPPYYEKGYVLQAGGTGMTVPSPLPPAFVLQSSDALYYRLNSGDYLIISGFSASASGEIERVVLWAQYRLETVQYEGQQSLLCMDDFGTFRRTDVIPIDGETTDINKSYDITSFYPQWDQTVLSNLFVRFTNNDTAPFAYVEFNAIWLDIHMKPINETAYVYQDFSRTGRVGYQDTEQTDFSQANSTTNLELFYDPGNVTLEFSGERKTEIYVQTSLNGNDSFIASGSDSKTNYGDLNRTELSETTGKRVLMRFDLSSIPSGARVESAYMWLQMYWNIGLDKDVEFYPITRQWFENNVTWEDPWMSFGGDYNQSALLTTTPIRHSYGHHMLVGWDVTDALRDWGAGAHPERFPNYGMIGIIEDADLLPNEKSFYSSEIGNTSLAPRLEVTYSNITYLPSATLESTVFDAGRNVTWEEISWTQSVIPGIADLEIQTRSGWMPDPSTNPEAWESWAPATYYQNPAGERIVSSPNRYLQYRAIFTTNDLNYSPVLSDVLVRWSDVELSFDYTVESLFNINRATLSTYIDNEEMWKADLGPIGWSSEKVDISKAVFDDEMHQVKLGLTLFSNISGDTSASARFDNVRIGNPLDGEYVSPVFGPGHYAIWENISWDGTFPPGTNVEIRTRVGNSSIPDSNWSAWSSPYQIKTGDAIPQAFTSFIQYNIFLSTTDGELAPEIDFIKIEYSNFPDWGTVETNNFSPFGVLEWGIFDASANVPPGTDIKYFYSTNFGISWLEMTPGFNMSSVAIPNIKVKAELSTIVNGTTPLLYHMNLSYVHPEPLDWIEMSIVSWSGTADDSLDIDAIGRDKYGKVVTFQQFWETSDPNGTVLSNGLYSPGSAGTWRVYCNNSDNSVSNYTTVTVSPGAMVEVGVNPWNPGTITADDTITFNAYGFDADGNIISQAIVNWSVTNGIGTIDPGPSFSAFFDATTVGAGRVIADDGQGNVNVTSIITVVPGATADIAINPWDPGPITADDTVLFSAYGKDGDENFISNVLVNWSVVGGIGSIPQGPSSSALFDADRVGSGRIIADDGLGHSNSTNVFSVTAGAVGTIEVVPSYAEVGTGEEQNFTAQGYDADGNPVTLVTTMWTTTVGNIIQATPTSATLLAQDTEQLGGWVNATQGPAVGSAVVDVVERPKDPVIQGLIPNQTRPEDYGSWSMDLSGFASDPNEGLSTLMWNLKDYNSSLYTVSGINIAGNHILVFTTVPDAFGSDNTTIQLVNSLGYVDSQPIWINITPVNDNPVFSGAPDLFVRYDEPYSFDYTPYVSDIDDDISELNISTDDDTHTSVQELNVTFSFPESMIGETAYVLITVWDPALGCDSDIIAVRISSNYPPTLVRLLPDVDIFEGETKEDVFDLDAYIVDPDMDSLFFSFGYSHLTIVIDVDHMVDITAEEHWIGVEFVTFRAVDPVGGIAEDTIQVTVHGVNDAPQISDVPPFVVHYDYPFTFDLSPYISDVDNDTSELTVWTNNPSNVTVDGVRLTLLYPEYWFGNRYPYTVPLTIFVSDGLASSFQVITVSVTDNYPPEVFRLLPDLTFDEDFQYEFAFDLDDYFVDSDSDTLFFVSGQEILVVTIHQNHTVTFEAPLNWFGSEVVTFRAIDSGGAIIEDSIRVEVMPINDPPIVQDIPNQLVEVRYWTLDLAPYVSDVDNNVSELVVTTSSAHIVVVSLMLFFDYPEGVNEETVTIRVGDGFSNTTRQILVVIVGPEPIDWLAGNWIWIVALVAAIVTVLGTGWYFVLRKPLIIEDLFLIHNNGMLLEHHTRRLKMTVDHDILSGMLTAILEFAKETFTYGEGGALRKMDLGERIIFLDRGRFVTLAVVVRGEEPEFLSERMQFLIDDIEETYPDIAMWDGRVGIYEGLPGMLDGFIEGMYEKGFWKNGQKKIKSLFNGNNKNNSVDKPPKDENN
jgi:hypothetical protein